MRIILIALGVAVVGAVGVFMFVLSSLDGLIKDAVEAHGSQITKVRVTLAAVEIDLTSGRGALSGLSIGNPPGFETPSAFDLGSISVTIDASTLADDTVVIREIVIEGPVITYEIGADGSNIDAIQRNVDEFMAQFGGGGSSGSSPGEGPKLVIEDIYIRGGAVNVSAGFLDGASLGSELPDIHLEDIGRRGDGATPAEVAERVIAAITEGATSAISGLGLETMMGGAGTLLEGVAAGAGELLEAGGGLSDAAEGAGEALEGAAEGAADALGKLFGGSSD